MDITLWILQIVAVPIACSVYAGLIVSRYLDFAQLRGKAVEVEGEVSRHFFLLSYRGKDKYDEDFSRLPGQKDGLLLFGDLMPVSWKLKEKGHDAAARIVEARCMELCNELNRRLEKGKFTEEQWKDYFLSPKRPVEIHPNIWPLLTPLKWNL